MSEQFKKHPWVLLWFLALFLIGSYYTFGTAEELPMDLNRIAAAPTLENIFGYDTLGRSLGPRVFRGGLVSLETSLMAGVVSFLLGVIFGGLMELAPKWINILNWSLIEILNSLPTLMLSAVVISMWTLSRENLQPWQLGLLLGMTSWWTTARIASSQVQSLFSHGYIEAARALGASPLRIFFRHLMPALIKPVGAYVLIQLPNFILIEGFLSFVGLGFQPPEVSWGLLMQEGWKVISLYPHIMFWPSLLILLTLFFLNSVSIRRKALFRERVTL